MYVMLKSHFGNWKPSLCVYCHLVHCVQSLSTREVTLWTMWARLLGWFVLFNDTSVRTFGIMYDYTFMLFFKEITRSDITGHT